MRRDCDMEAWAVFCRCAELGSIRKACEALGEDPSAVTRLIQSLEKSIGQTLFDRASRPAVLTPAGRRAWKAMAPVVASHERALSLIRTDSGRAGGPVTFASPAGFGAVVLPRLFIEFQAEHPEIELIWTEVTQDHVKGAAEGSPAAPDIVCAYGPLSAAAAPVASMGRMWFVPCASPLYIRRHGAPERPSDCARHRGILIESPGRRSAGSLSRGGRSEALSWKSVLRFQNVPSILQAVKLGAGISPDLPVIYFLPELRAGALEPVMRGWGRSPLECLMITNPSSQDLLRVRLFRDWFANRMSGIYEDYERIARGVLA